MRRSHAPGRVHCSFGQLNESAMNRFANRRRRAGSLQFFKQTFDMRLHGSLKQSQCESLGNRKQNMTL